jgi:hypothetical protein
MNCVKVEIRGMHIPSFKNHKRAIIDKKTSHARTLTDPKIAKRVQRLEDAILSALYSESQIIGSETHSECWKRLRTLLSGLCDDSIREVPAGSWDVLYVQPGQEGVDITITRL